MGKFVLFVFTIHWERIDIFISLERRPSSRTWIVTLASDLFVYPPLTLNQPDHNQMYGNTWWSFLQTLEVHILTSSVYTTFNQPVDSNEWWSEHFDHLSFLLFEVDKKIATKMTPIRNERKQTQSQSSWRSPSWPAQAGMPVIWNKTSNIWEC